ncbi:MAG: hypothetical protein ACREE4_13335 [Stellaceae bacterium]
MNRKPQSDSSDPIEITPGMIKAGVEAMWGYLEPDETVLREGVIEIYLAMELAHRQSSR